MPTSGSTASWSRRYAISSYRSLPRSRYDQALEWLRGWYHELGELAGVLAAIPLADFHARQTFSDSTEHVICCNPASP